MKTKVPQSDVSIVEYQAEHREMFKQLNEEWIDHYFELEEEDRKLLDKPKENILDKGGFIYIALYQDEVVGTCALVPMDDPHFDFEIGKMAVAPKMRGRKIGWALGQAVVTKAKEIGCKKLYLESNSALAPAIKLYEKMGFKRITGHPSPYARCDVQMELKL